LRTLDQLDSTVRLLQATHLKQSELLKIATSPLLAASLMPAVISQFRREFPGVRVELLDVPVADVAESVRSGQADIGVCTSGQESRDLKSEVIFQDALCVACPEGHELAAMDSVEWADLVEFPLIVLMGKFMYPCEIEETYTDWVWVQGNDLDHYISEIQKWWEYRQKANYTVTHKEKSVRFHSDGTFSYIPEGDEYILNHYARNYGIMIGGIRIKKEVYFYPTVPTLTRDEKKTKDYFTWEDSEDIYGDEYEKLTTHVDHVQDEGSMTGWKTLGTRKEYTSSYVKGRDVEFVRTYTPKEGYEFLGTHNIGYVGFETTRN
jgi:hypothetical protein